MPRQPRPWFRKQTGSWYIQLNGRQVSLGKDRQKAFEKYHALMAGNNGGGFEQVDLLLDEFLEFVKNNLAERTYETYRHYIGSFNAVAPRRIGDLKAIHVTRWLDNQADWGDSTKNLAVRAVKRAFNWGVEQGLIERSPVASVTPPASLPRDVLLSRDQWEQLVGAVPDQEFRDYITTLRETGARPQEVRVVGAQHVRGDTWLFAKIDSKGARADVSDQKKRRLFMALLSNQHLVNLTRGSSTECTYSIWDHTPIPHIIL